MKPQIVACLGLFVVGCATTGGSIGARAGETWTASRSVDPITSVERCVVAAPDRVFGSAYSRVGYLYPFVETNSEIGLLVGVTSGGQVRVPPGDIQWRVDQNSHRTLQAANTPVIGEPTEYVDTSGMAPEARSAFEASQAMTAGLMSSIQNGVTAVGEPEATEMLTELRAGSELLFRATASAPAAGLPSSRTYQVGQLRDGAIRPIPIDQSFHDALSECGIGQGSK